MSTRKSFRDGVDYAFDRVSQVMNQLTTQLQEARERALDLPEPVRPKILQERINALPFAARRIYEQVLDTMQDAEEIGGPEGEEYVALMQAIIDEASERQSTCRTFIDEQTDG